MESFLQPGLEAGLLRWGGSPMLREPPGAGWRSSEERVKSAVPLPGPGALPPARPGPAGLNPELSPPAFPEDARRSWVPAAAPPQEPAAMGSGHNFESRALAERGSGPS